MTATATKITRFALTGAIGFVLDFGCTFLLKEKLSVYPYIANSIGFSFAVINNYLINKYWTFGERSKPDFSQFFSFAWISVVGLLLNTLFLALLYGWLGIHFYVAKITATMAVMLWNYLANSKITFKTRRKTIFLQNKESV